MSDAKRRAELELRLVLALVTMVISVVGGAMASATSLVVSVLFGVCTIQAFIRFARINSELHDMKDD